MGIDVCANRFVSYNKNHNRGINSSPSSNPTYHTLGTLKVANVFSRNNRLYRDDGNPLIYALKGLKHFKISRSEIRRFRPDYLISIDKVVNQLGKVDAIVVPPSSSKIAWYVGRSIQIRTQAALYSNVFRKKKVSSYLNLQLSQVAKKHQADVKKQLSTWKKIPNAEISLKKIPKKIRHYFPPLELLPTFNISHLKGNIIVVDDLFASGTTLTCAQSVLGSHSINVTGGVCLLGELKLS